jgi:hypothetical protein
MRRPSPHTVSQIRPLRLGHRLIAGLPLIRVSWQSRLVCIIRGLILHGANISQTSIHALDECGHASEDRSVSRGTCWADVHGGGKRHACSSRDSADSRRMKLWSRAAWYATYGPRSKLRTSEFRLVS